MRAAIHAIAAVSSLALAALLSACSATDTGSLHEPGSGVGDPASAPEDAPVDDTTAAAAPETLVDANGAPTWTSIYELYFGPGSLGHCNDTRCHVSSRGGFKCGLTKDTCYTGLIASKLVTTSTPTRSPLSDKSRSPLSWFGGTRGTMPRRGASNPKASADIAAWINAGAKNN
jgi:hypothetical protein